MRPTRKKTQPPQKFDEITYDRVLSRGLRVMDITATAMCKENKLPIYVFNMDIVGNLKRVLEGENIGTFVRITPPKQSNFFSYVEGRSGLRCASAFIVTDTRHANIFHAKRLSSKIKKSNRHLFHIPPLIPNAYEIIQKNLLPHPLFFRIPAGPQRLQQRRRRVPNRRRKKTNWSWPYGYEPSEDLLAVADIKLTYTDGYGQKHTEAVKKKFEKSVIIVTFPSTRATRSA